MHIFLLETFYFISKFFYLEQIVLFSLLFLNLWPATFWTQIKQSCHCEIVKVKIVGQVTCHFGFASADNFLMNLKRRSGHVDSTISIPNKRNIQEGRQALLDHNPRFSLDRVAIFQLFIGNLKVLRPFIISHQPSSQLARIE